MEMLIIYLEQQLLTNCYVIKHLILLKIQNMMHFSVDLLQWFIIFSIRSPLSGGAVKSETMLNQQLAEKLNKPIIRKLEKQKVHSSFVDNIWGADLADI